MAQRFSCFISRYFPWVPKYIFPSFSRVWEYLWSHNQAPCLPTSGPGSPFSLASPPGPWPWRPLTPPTPGPASALRGQSSVTSDISVRPRRNYHHFHWHVSTVTNSRSVRIVTRTVLCWVIVICILWPFYRVLQKYDEKNKQLCEQKQKWRGKINKEVFQVKKFSSLAGNVGWVRLHCYTNYRINFYDIYIYNWANLHKLFFGPDIIRSKN